jgi:hypothetical protein
MQWNNTDLGIVRFRYGHPSYFYRYYYYYYYYYLFKFGIPR